MEEQEKKKRIELEQDMSWKMYQILTITACTANLIGTICNFCIHGMKLPAIPLSLHDALPIDRKSVV